MDDITSDTHPDILCTVCAAATRVLAAWHLESKMLQPNLLPKATKIMFISPESDMISAPIKHRGSHLRALASYSSHTG